MTMMIGSDKKGGIDETPPAAVCIKVLYTS